MKVIIIGAGSGKRIGEFAKKIPKSLLKINGKTILERQVSLFKKNNLNKIIVVTGPNKEKFDLKDISYVFDSKYSEHDILGSLMEARNFFNDELIVTYSDIIYDESVLQQILESKSDIGIVIDFDWEKSYVNRTEHPKIEAENVLVDNSGNIIEIRKNIQNKNNNVAEFLGVIKLSKSGAKEFIKKFEMLEKCHKGDFHNAKSLSKAYLTDMIQELVDSKTKVTPIAITGKWCEVDTLQDLQNAEKIFL